MLASTKLFTIGSQSSSCYKSVSGASGYSCPMSTISKSTPWYGGDTYGDLFSCTVSGNTLTVKRIDSGGQGCHGWGMNLRFYLNVAATPSPTGVPTRTPTRAPTSVPTVAPTRAPTSVPTVAPSTETFSCHCTGCTGHYKDQGHIKSENPAACASACATDSSCKFSLHDHLLRSAGCTSLFRRALRNKRARSSTLAI